jgi:hypothetical protein
MVEVVEEGGSFCWVCVGVGGFDGGRGGRGGRDILEREREQTLGWEC